MYFVKTFAIVVASAFILTGCTSDPEQIAFNKWKQTTYKVEGLNYDNSELKQEAQKELKPLLDNINKNIPSGRFKNDIEILKDDNWKRNICKDYVDVAGEQILAPLEQPVIGDMEAFTASGYISVPQLKKTAETLKTELVEAPDDANVLDGSNAEYPYTPKKYLINTETDTFRIVITANSGWNALIWEEYYTEEDPGKIDTKDFPLPSDEYMPFILQVYYKPACEKL